MEKHCFTSNQVADAAGVRAELQLQPQDDQTLADRRVLNKMVHAIDSANNNPYYDPNLSQGFDTRAYDDLRQIVDRNRISYQIRGPDDDDDE